MYDFANICPALLLSVFFPNYNSNKPRENNKSILNKAKIMFNHLYSVILCST